MTMDFSEVTQAMATRCGLASLPMAPDGACALRFDEVTVTFRPAADGSAFVMQSTLGATDGEDPLLLGEMLAANFETTGLAHGTLCLDAARSAYLLRNFAMSGLELQDVFEALPLFVGNARHWQARLRGDGSVHSHPAPIPAASTMPMPIRERLIELARTMGFAPQLLLDEHAFTLPMNETTPVSLRWQMTPDSLHVAAKLGEPFPSARQAAYLIALLANSVVSQHTGRSLALDCASNAVFLCEGLHLRRDSNAGLAVRVTQLLCDAKDCRNEWTRWGWIADVPQPDQVPHSLLGT